MFEIKEEHGFKVIKTDEDLKKDYLCVDDLTEGEAYEVGKYSPKLFLFETDGVTKTQEDWWKKIKDHKSYAKTYKNYVMKPGEKFVFIGTIPNKEVESVKQYGVLVVDSQNVKIGFLHEKDRVFVPVKD